MGAAVVDIYMELLQEVRQRLPRSPIFVHPVPHVLPETRFLTVAFNNLLTKAKTAASLTKANVRLLEFDTVFAGEGEPTAESELLPELKLDNTHMSPNYVASHLAPALTRVWPRT